MKRLRTFLLQLDMRNDGIGARFARVTVLVSVAPPPCPA